MNEKKFWKKLIELQKFASEIRKEATAKHDYVQSWVWWVIVDALETALDARIILLTLSETK